MIEFIVSSKYDILLLKADKPVTICVDGNPYVLCTDEYFEKQKVDHGENGAVEHE